MLYFLLFAAVLSFDEEVSKTISLGQYKASAVCNDAAKTESKLAVEEKDIHKMETPPVTKVSGPRFSVSTPRQSKTGGTTPRSARSGAAHSVRGTYVKSKSGFSKYGHRPPRSPSSSLTKLAASQPSSCMTKKVADSELSAAPKTSSKIDGPVANSCRCLAADDAAASFSRLFAGSFMSVLRFFFRVLSFVNKR